MNDCSCIRGNYNFHVEAIDKETLIYQDLSDWMDEERYEYPTDYLVTIIPHATSLGKDLTLSVGDTNKLTSSELGSVLDGVYCFMTTSCGKAYKRSKAIFPHIACCVKQAYATLDEREGVEEVEYYLNLATINAEQNNVKTAYRNLDIAKKPF